MQGDKPDFMHTEWTINFLKLAYLLLSLEFERNIS